MRHDQPSTSVIEAVADAEDTVPVLLNRQLYDAIDPTALNQLFDCDSTPGHVQFQYHGYQITVYNADDIKIEPADTT